ncbi:hypothetical protein RRG08_067209 [Elysia crispata]|uniref:Integrase catalytic domain-containing protein n=1 Tax=Elysia crispata TaxID=231223 RepID=A0AAE1E9P2_9GAST|nr:hypothetical protein RRG08_067209 [Elysia crispata]
MTSDTQDYCASCNRCQVAKTPPVKFSQTTGHIISRAPLELVAIDFTKLELASDGREDVLVCTDVFTKWTISAPTRDQTARTVARVLLREWIPHYGVPLRLHSDQGRSFDAEIVICLCEHYGMQRSRTTPYNPQGTWFSSTNSTPHATTGESPFLLLFGREPQPTPGSLHKPYIPKGSTPVPRNTFRCT